jgi:hypothetical protein
MRQSPVLATLSVGQRDILASSGSKISLTKNQCVTGREYEIILHSHLLALWFLARLILDLEDGDNTFLRNVGSNTDYMAPYPRI